MTSKYNFAFGHEMLLGMNFDGREAKLEVEKICLASVEGEFYGLCSLKAIISV